MTGLDASLLSFSTSRQPFPTSGYHRQPQKSGAKIHKPNFRATQMIVSLDYIRIYDTMGALIQWHLIKGRALTYRSEDTRNTK